MSLFKQREPRRFQHTYIYYDERKEKLRNIEDNARRRLGMLPEKEHTTEEAIRGKFAEQTTHLKSHLDGERKHLSPLAAILLIIALFAVWRLLLQ